MSNSTNLLRLNAAILANEQLDKAFAEYRDKSETRIQVLYNENKVLKAEVAHLKASENDINERLNRLESQLGIVYVDGDGEQNMEVDEEGKRSEAVGGTNGGAIGGTNGVMDGGAVGATHSEAAGERASGAGGGEEAENPEQVASGLALKSKTFRDLMTESFKKLMGVQKLEASSLPGYPMGIGEASDVWPKDKSTGKSLLRFDWRVGKHDDPVNVDGLQKVVKHMETAAEQVPARKAVIEKIQVIPGELEKAVRTKYMRMANEYRKVEKKRKRTEDDDEFGDGEVEVVETNVGRAQRNSRVQSKLDARKRKRASQECDPKWKESKYDTAFILNAMSDDDDDPNHIPGEPLAFVTMEPEWRHPQVSELFSAIDALKDPRPDQAKLAKTRKRSSEKKPGAPPLARTLVTRVRTWMVKPDLLQQNPEWFTTGRVVSSGAAWEEGEPKELPKDKKEKGKAIASEAGPSTKKIVIQKRKVGDEAESSKAVAEAAQKKIDELLDGRQAVDQLFE